MRLLVVLIFTFLAFSQAMAADLRALSELFVRNYNTFYQPRFCGRNTARLITEAAKRNIDLRNSYVLKIEGGGFLETSGFYTRSAPNDRALLGYFHMVLVADGYVFDFDLAEPLVLKVEDYIRLQFTPPHEPFLIFGIKYRALEQLPSWQLTRFETLDYARNKEVPTAKGKLGQIIDLNRVMKLPRLR